MRHMSKKFLVSQPRNMEPVFLADCHACTEWHEGPLTRLKGAQPNNPQLLRSWNDLSAPPLLQRGCIGAL